MTGLLSHYVIEPFPKERVIRRPYIDLTLPLGDPALAVIPAIHYRDEDNDIYPLISPAPGLVLPPLLILDPSTPYDMFRFKALFFAGFTTLDFYRAVLTVNKLAKFDEGRFLAERDALMQAFGLPMHLTPEFITFVSERDDATIAYLRTNAIGERGAHALMRFNTNEVYILTKELFRFRMAEDDFVKLIDLVYEAKRTTGMPVHDILFRWDVQKIVEEEAPDAAKYARIHEKFHSFCHPEYTRMKSAFTSRVEAMSRPGLTIRTDALFERTEIEVSMTASDPSTMASLITHARRIDFSELFAVIGGNAAVKAVPKRRKGS